MRSLFVVVAAGAAFLSSPASAKMMACTGENMAKSLTTANAMEPGPKKMAVMKEMGAANAAMSKGNMRGACKSYMSAQKMASKK